jgi:putative NADPH-quinone reductase
VSGPLIFLGSSRGDGNTKRALAVAFPDEPLIDLSVNAIAPYDYEHRYPDGDAFIALAERMVQHDDIVLATPVYWYAMAAQMKLFLDRWSDLITIRKDLGRGLAGRRLWMLATSPEPDLPPGFETPFQLTAKYMEMAYAGCVHASCAIDLEFDDSAKDALRAFGQRVLAT